MPDSDCETCVRLWKEYQLATIEQLRAANRVHLSVADLEEFKKAVRMSDAAEQPKESARLAVVAHQAESGH